MEIQVGPLLFQFDSKLQWVQKAQSWYRHSGVKSSRTIAIDAAGRICTHGREFMRAEEEGTYPIRVYSIEAERKNDGN